jgi:hypothetical protein
MPGTTIDNNIPRIKIFPVERYRVKMVTPPEIVTVKNVTIITSFLIPNFLIKSSTIYMEFPVGIIILKKEKELNVR